ncbi:MAG: hypothetical protein M1817_004781 [Caeruleum heppii]|nr:MAG: hypothetical protein M1817_004781 [Caeruleum heppii]
MAPLSGLMAREVSAASLRESKRPHSACEVVAPRQDRHRSSIKSSEDSHSTHKSSTEGRRGMRALFSRKRSTSSLRSNPTFHHTDDDESDEDFSGVDLTNLCPPIQSPTFRPSASPLCLTPEPTPSPRPSQLIWDPNDETWLKAEDVTLRQGSGIGGFEERSSRTSAMSQAAQATIVLHEEGHHDPPPCYIQSQLEEASRRNPNTRRNISSPNTEETLSRTSAEEYRPTSPWARRANRPGSSHGMY